MNSHVRMPKMWSVLLLAICSSLNGDFRPSDCKIVCPKNEEYAEVTTTCNTCDNLLGNVPCVEDECGDPGCQCRPGFYRNNRGKCVTKKQCFANGQYLEESSSWSSEYDEDDEERNQSSRKSSQWSSSRGRGRGQSSSWSSEYDEDDEESNESSRRSSQWSSQRGRGSRGKGQFSKESSSWSEEQDKDDEERSQSSRWSSQWSSKGGRGRKGQHSSWSSEYDEDDEEDYDYQSSRRSSHWSSSHEEDSSEETDDSSTWSSGRGKRCGKNEIIVACAKPKWCNTCEIKGNCKLSAESCKKGCDCKRGYYRNGSGICIRESKCSKSPHAPICFLPLCKEPECKLNYDGKPCPACECKGKPPVHCNIPFCPLNCEINYKTKPCPSCKCKNSGNSPGTCGKNEVYKECGTACPATCSNLGIIEVCTGQCVKGCFCRDGLVRNSHNKCVKPEKCSMDSPPPIPTCALPHCKEPDCKLNFDTKPCPSCECKGKPPVRCSIPNCPVDCEINFKTKPCPSCKCKRPGHSPGRCGKHEVYKDCGSACPATCANHGIIEVCTEQCIKGCFCRNGFLRNSHNKCVRPEKCSKDSPPVPTCPLPPCREPECKLNFHAKPCPTCECKGKPPVICSIPNCPVDCEINYKTKPCPSCKCKPSGHSPGRCGKHEVYKECGSACPATCSNHGIIEVCTEQCIKGCFCRDGFVRNSHNKCVKPEKCSKDSPPVPTCALPFCKEPECKLNFHAKPCPTCECKGKPPVHCNIPFCPYNCEIDYMTKPCPSCKCQHSGHSPGSCGKHEEYKECGTTCPATCSNLGIIEICTEQCVKGCFCRDGFVRNSHNKCVKPEKCSRGPPPVQCSPLKCDEPGCNLNYKTKPCPTCECVGKPPHVSCGIPKCDGPGCEIDYESKPCPTCNCEAEGPPPIQCSPPKCDGPGCKIDYKTKPCPSCKCTNGAPPNEMCGKNEEYYNCKPTCKNTCENYLAKNPICPRICIKGCGCKKGYVIRKDGKCVKPKQCDDTSAPPTEICGKNEEYYNCKPTCRNTCENYSAKVPLCPRICNKGCACKKGYVKRQDGKCVKPNQCDNTSSPPNEICGKNEEYYDCKPTCKNTCENYSAKVPLCPRICNKGCACKKGYVKRQDGKCVKPNQCDNNSSSPTEMCGKNEEYYNCKPTCKNTCENYLAINPICPRICIKGCGCKKGYLIRKDGKCVKPKQCDDTSAPPTEICGKNEEYYNCKPTCKNTCENYSAKVPLCPRICIKGCACKKGYVKRQDGKCVIPNQCDNTSSPPNGICGKNEEYYDCKPTCKNTCENYSAKVPLCARICNKGCACKKGFVKRKDGKCVKPNQCDITSSPPGEQCGEDEEFHNCKPTCKNTCENYRAKNHICPLICIKGCACKKGLLRRKDGKCVKPSDCDKTPGNSPGTCGKNEEYKECGSACPKTCSNLGKIEICNALCVQGCFCRDGFVRNNEKKCVKPEKCSEGPPPIQCSPPKCDEPGCKLNYKTKPCPSCECKGVSCSMPKCDGPGCKIDYKTKPCPSCKCTNGAPPNGMCGKNEEYYNCKPTCKNTCENYLAINPICPRICIKGCGCKKGYVIRKDGKCVKPKECDNTSGNSPGRCGKNEVYKECGSACPATCSNLGIIETCTAQCVIGCFCQDGFVRNSEEKCVRPEKCPKGNSPGSCGKDEVYKECGSACPATCSNLGIIGPCTKQCVQGCFCRDGLVRNSKNKCVKLKKCSKEKCPPNEQYSDCAIPCNDCQIKGKCNFLVCNKGCDCIKGHYRDESGRCIPERLCPTKKKCPPNEQYSDCAVPCNDCQTRGKCNFLVCNKGCDCIKGHYRNESGRCIPENLCPSNSPSDNCGQDEVWNECGSACPPTCSNLGKKQVCTLQCVPGCFCRKGLVRDDSGKCVQPDQCPKLTPPNSCGKDEVFNQCGSACPPTCSNLGKSVPCTLQCVPGCFCREGLVRNDLNECVKSETCSIVPPIQVCGINEEYYECVPNCRNTCETYQQKNIACPLYCKKGCGCKNGFVRRKDGKCVRPDQCEKTPENCTRRGEEFKTCGSPCEATCSTLHFKNLIKCPKPCKPGCFCKDGLVRDSQNNCIKPEKCNTNCGLREKYYDCKPSCTNVCNPPDVCAAVCIPGCFCSEGLVLREDGHCVKREFCGQSGQPSCDINEQYYDCIPDCGNTCKTYGRTDIACTAICRPGCFCKPGLVLNDENKCVLPELCPIPVKKCESPDQQYYDCKPDCENTCDNYGKPVVCLKICKPGCFCKPGLVLNKENVCVKPKECPNSGYCKDKNMQFYECKPDCKNNCKNYFNPGIRCGCGPPGCFCKQGLVLREDGQCVLPKHCKRTGHHGHSSSSESQSSGYSDQSSSGSTSSQSSSSQSGSESSQTSGQTISESSGYQSGSQSSQTSGQTISESSGYQSGSQISQTSGQIISGSSGYQSGSQISQTSGQTISESSGYQSGSQSSQTSGQIISGSSGYQSGSQISQTSGQIISGSSGYQSGSQSSQTSDQIISESLGYQSGSQSSQTSGQIISESSGYQSGSQSSQTSGQIVSESSGYQSGSQNSQTSGQIISESSGYQSGSQTSQTSGQSISQSSGYETGSQSSQSSGQSISESSGYQIGSQSSQTSGQSISESSGYQSGIQISQTSGQSISESLGYQSGSQSSQTSGQLISQSSGYQSGGINQNSQSLSQTSSVYQNENLGQNSQILSQSSSSSSTSQDGSISQGSQSSSQSSSLIAAQQDGIVNQNSQSSIQSVALSSTQQDGSFNQNSQASSQSSSLIAAQQEGILNQNSLSTSQSSSSSSINQDSSSYQSAQSNAGSSSSSFVSQDGSASQISQSVADSSSSSSSSSSTLVGSSSQTSQSASDSSSLLSPSSIAYQSGQESNNMQTGNDFQSWSSGYQEGSNKQDGQITSQSSSWTSDNNNQNEQVQNGFSSYSSAFEEANSQSGHSSAMSWSSANENQNEFSQSGFSSSSQGSDSQSSQSSSSSSWSSESSSDSESSSQISSWFSTIKDEGDSVNEQSESSSSSLSSGFQTSENSQNGQSNSQSSSWSTEFTDGTKAQNGDVNGGYSSRSSGYKEENGVRVADWDDSISSWSSGSTNEAGM